MNQLLEIKLRFQPEPNKSRVSGRNLRADNSISTGKINSLIENLQSILRYYNKIDKILEGVLIDVNYNDIIAKSNRIKELFKLEKTDVNDLVVGARFSNDIEGEEKHIITYYVSEKNVCDTIKKLEIANRFLSERLPGYANSLNFNFKDKTINYEGYEFKKAKLRDILIDASVVEAFSVPAVKESVKDNDFIISFYKTELPLSKLFEKLKIDSYIYHYTLFGSDSISTSKKLFDVLQEKIPYLISMVSSDWARITLEETGIKKELPDINIPKPSNEPIIGVIDTFFDEDVYFSDWVENQNYLDELEQLSFNNPIKEHGTQVSSIIVDGPRMNPWLDDGCGRFRVRHFGVCEEKITIPRLLQKIKDIVDRNSDIHVWNLSLGTNEEISKNFISFDASVLDELQAQKNIVFVVSGTNDNRLKKKEQIKIGSPADSLNSIVVNSVKRDSTPASYSRKGTVLSFFNKPDVSYYGGDFNDRIIAYSPTEGDTGVYGTSFAAPWISRKLCYLIDIIGLPREVAKALIIDSAAGWNYKVSTYKNKDLVGYGIVPINIEDILKSPSEEIRFTIYGTASSYKTTNYSIPVPKDEDGKYPFIARATMCYFPMCTRTQGVDYTDRELSLSFGRVKKDGSIESINENIQDNPGAHITERQSRKDFRKWENTKFISKIDKNKKSVISYDERLWGISVISKERLSSHMGASINFGAIITLKELNGVNRIPDFIKACMLRGIIVNQINIQNRVDVYNSNQNEITLE